MPVYTYRVRDKFGTLVTGKKEDDSSESVRKFLASRNYFVVSIKAEKTKLRWLKNLSGKRVKSQEVFFFFRQFSVLIKAGISVISAIDSIARQMENEYFQGLLVNISEKIKSGDSLSNAMRLYPDVFSYTNVNMIEAAEMSGQLEQVLERIAVLMQKSEHTKANIKAAVTYPIIIFSVAVLVVSFILIFILPKFVSIYNKRLIDLPIPTQIVLVISKLMSDYWHFLALGILLIIYIVQKATKNNEAFLYKWHSLIMKIPYFGNLYFFSRLSNFCAVLGFMYRSGVPLLKALRILETIVDNKILENVIKQSADSIEIGDTLTNALTRSDIFPDTLLKMIAAGESSGKIDDLMIFISDYYDEEIEFKIKKMSAVLEPIMILIIGVIVGFIAIATLLPIFTLMKSFRAH